MKKTTLFLTFLLIGLGMFAQYTGNKLPSGLTVAGTASDADYTIIQKNGETYVKAIRMDSLRSYMTEGMAADVIELDSVAGNTGQIIISDGAGWLSPSAGKYEGTWSWSFGSRGVGAIGTRSFLIGTGGGIATADNSVSIAGGKATALRSVAFINATASGVYSFAVGDGSVASGDNSAAFGSGTASGTLSKAWGDGSTAIGIASTAWGTGSATGKYSTVWGDGATASGESSTAWNNGTANGTFSTAWNSGTSQSCLETSFGQFVDTAATKTADSWVSTDRLLTIGNGTLGSPSNALVMLKNGNTTVSGQWSFNAGLIVGTDATAASSANVGAIRYRVDANNSWCEMVMQTGAATWEWVVIKTNTW